MVLRFRSSSASSSRTSAIDAIYSGVIRVLQQQTISRRARRMHVTRELRKGFFLAKKKLAGWGFRILEGRTAMKRKAGVKWTQADLGKAVGVSAQQISRYEAETDEPGWDMWRKMARALLIEDPGELAFGTEERKGRRGGLGGNDAAETA